MRIIVHDLGASIHLEVQYNGPLDMNEQQYLAILGRQPELSLAELQSVLGADHVTPIKQAAILSTLPDMSMLGGTIKLAQIIGTFDNASWREALEGISTELTTSILPKFSGKISIGLSVYNANVRSRDIGASLLQLKKTLKNDGFSIRTIPNRTAELNTAQIIHNRLDQTKGIEVIIISDKRRQIVAITQSVQDIYSYTERDRYKPARDAQNGMLPPKLAQIMLNLAGVQTGQTVLDPFCGTGTVLLEALLRGCSVVGSDISQDMVEAASKNIDWLRSVKQNISGESSVSQADAQSATWATDINALVSETFLGPPLRALPPQEELKKIVSKVDDLHRKTLQNLSSQLKKDDTLCLAIPAWRLKQKFLHLPVVDDLEHLGYNQLDFKQGKIPLLYHRPQAIVARQLLVLKRK